MKNQVKPSPSGTKSSSRTKRTAAIRRVSPPKNAWAGKIDRRKAAPFDGVPADEASRLKATKSPPKASKQVEPEETAPAAVGALIRSGDDARALFEVLRRFGDEFAEPLDSLIELGMLLPQWESHRSGDAPFWSNVAAACSNLSEELDELQCSIDFGIARVLFGAIQNAALAHLDEARASTQD